ncbi:hypothetical protein BOTBODRAFT_58219 [Botryobasidium botryosum FD-172 SS1]|uniref:DUF7053 domain-containing protein n=1 Tax=Botryobasidium botryosum (strain FD-172 SS1) TaxID=930990 RepID=A0A067MFK3_BOTB1|nr:hypothetical protein BOTBODRAFT_58219 [Botryobasidium botryosum FD-172 SS1]
MSTATIVSSKIINAPIADVISILHDPPRMAHLNPLVVSVVQSAEDPQLYTITDKMKLGGVVPMPSFSYTARFAPVEDGVDSEVEAMGLLKSHNQWRARAIGESQCEVTETAFVDVSKFFKPFVMRTTKQAHADLLETMAKELEKPKETRSG